MTVRRILLEFAGAALVVGIVLLMISGPIRDAKSDAKYREAQAEARMKARLFTKYDKAMIAEAERMTFPIAAYPQDEPKK